MARIKNPLFSQRARIRKQAVLFVREYDAVPQRAYRLAKLNP